MKFKFKDTGESVMIKTNGGRNRGFGPIFEVIYNDKVIGKIYCSHQWGGNKEWALWGLKDITFGRKEDAAKALLLMKTNLRKQFKVEL